jgi:LysM repeat protein
MRFYSKKRILAILFVVWVSILAACVSSNSSENPTSTVAYSLILYKTISPTNIVTPETENDVTRIPSPSPTLTPITYTVVEGDTMLEIALHYGIKLEDLLASNPNVDPQFLSVGTALVIPAGEDHSAVFATATPLPIDFGNPVCYRVINDGVWCFSLVRNDFQQPLEGISGKIELVTSDGGELLVGLANTPINILPVGKAVPLVLYYSKPISENFTPHINQVTALLVTSEESLNILVNLLIGEVSISMDGSSATISGDALIPDGGKEVQTLSVVLVAYNDEGQVVGVRRKDTNGKFQPGDSVPFKLTVYSLGSPIHHVDALGEAIP